MFQQRWQDRAPDERGCNAVSIGRTKALAITLRTLPISTQTAIRLLNSGNGPSQREVNGVDCRLPGKLELLFRVQRCRIGDIADVEVGNEAQHALLFLDFDLLLGHFDL